MKLKIKSHIVIILAGVTAGLHIWKLPPAITALKLALGIDLLQASFLLSVVQIGGMTLGLAVGLFAERIGLRRCMLIGIGMLGGASFIGSFANGAATLMVLRTVEGCGFLLTVLPAPALLRMQVPPSRLHQALGWWAAYMPAATAIALLSGAWLLAVIDWRIWWNLIGFISVLSFLSILFYVTPDEPRTPGNKIALSVLLKETLNARGPWLLALCFGLYTGQWLAVIGFLPTIYTQAGINGALVGILSSLAGGVGIIGNLGAGKLLQKGISARALLVTGFTVMTVCSFFTFGLDIPIAAKFLAVLIFSAIAGLIPSTLFSLAVSLAPSPRTISTTVGWMQQLSAAGQFVGPPLVAWVAQLSGGWQWTWTVTGACSIAGIILACLIRTKKTEKTESH